MSDASELATVDPYDAVLADLRAKRDEIERVIQTLENFRSGIPSAAPSVRLQGPDIAHSTGPGAFLGMTIVDAAKKHLAVQRRPLGNADIVSALKAGGMVLNSVDPINTVSSVLTRRFNVVGDVVRVGRGTWGLAEWYPNGRFKRKTSPKDEPADIDQAELDESTQTMVLNEPTV